MAWLRGVGLVGLVRSIMLVAQVGDLDLDASRAPEGLARSTRGVIATGGPG